MWMWSICGCLTASWTRQLQKIVIDFDQSSTDIQSCWECSPPCWRALCLCSSAFARRALMAGTVHLQRLDNTLLKEQLLLCSTDLAETSLWQPAQCRDLKCHSFYCDSFFFYDHGLWWRDNRCGEDRPWYELDIACTPLPPKKAWQTGRGRQIPRDESGLFLLPTRATSSMKSRHGKLSLQTRHSQHFIG